ncbi:hypothetical protein, partial [Bowmanella yangjiangensis]
PWVPDQWQAARTKPWTTLYQSCLLYNHVKRAGLASGSAGLPILLTLKAFLLSSAWQLVVLYLYIDWFVYRFFGGQRAERNRPAQGWPAVETVKGQGLPMLAARLLRRV